MPQLKAMLVRGWQLNTAMGMGYILFGVDAEGDDGSTGVKPLESALLLKEQHCRDLAEQLVQLADRLKSEVGSA
ncbi:hypothetical protein ACFSUK_28780 [Sphingobium scionense]|uniref:Uncharacterized protein n=2 Tax=Sphingobium scionense TaxID=1404341 RepID=A0A7W6LPA9_9SPHN|nr:hypothetical protein [Sphingobium scionense]